MKKKLLYVHHSGLLGGAPKSLTYLVSEVDREKYEAEILTIRNGPAVELLQSSGIPVKIAKLMFPFHGTTVSGMSKKLFVRNLIGAIPTYFMAKRYIKKYRPQIVHLNSTCLFLVAKAAKKVSKETVVICHVREPLLKGFAGDILKKMNHRYVDGFISIDQFDSSTINSKGKELEIVYNFVDFNKYNPKIIDTNYRKKLNIKNNDVVFLYMGRIVPGNGVLELIRAYQKAYGQNNNKHLIVAGFHNKSKYEEEVRGEALKTSNIHILEFQENAPELIASSDVMVCPFTKPHFSRSIIEAAAMMKPAIASDIGGPNELILNKTTGLLYDINREESLTECILQLGENENLRHEYGRNALDFARENFDSVKNARRTFEFYNRFKSNYNLQN